MIGTPVTAEPDAGLAPLESDGSVVVARSLVADRSLLLRRSFLADRAFLFDVGLGLTAMLAAIALNLFR